MMKKNDNRTKFRSQTSDNMDRWKSRGGKSQRRPEKRREDQRREEKIREEKESEKGRKVAKHYVFPMIWGSGGSKSRLANQTRDEKLHAVVARNTFRSKNIQNTPAPEHFWKMRR